MSPQGMTEIPIYIGVASSWRNADVTSNSGLEANPRSPSEVSSVDLVTLFFWGAFSAHFPIFSVFMTDCDMSLHLV